MASEPQQHLCYLKAVDNMFNILARLVFHLTNKPPLLLPPSPFTHKINTPPHRVAVHQGAAAALGISRGGGGCLLEGMGLPMAHVWMDEAETLWECDTDTWQGNASVAGPF